MSMFVRLKLIRWFCCFTFYTIQYVLFRPLVSNYYSKLELDAGSCNFDARCTTFCLRTHNLLHATPRAWLRFGHPTVTQSGTWVRVYGATHFQQYCARGCHEAHRLWENFQNLSLVQFWQILSPCIKEPKATPQDLSFWLNSRQGPINVARM